MIENSGSSLKDCVRVGIELCLMVAAFAAKVSKYWQAKSLMSSVYLSRQLAVI